MTKKTNRLILTLITSLLTIVIFSSWLFGPVAPVDNFQDILCNQIVVDSTKGAGDSLSAATYEDCVLAGENFAAGDKLYRFMVSDTDTFNIEFLVLDSSDIKLFLLTNAIDEDTETDCPDSCLFRFEGNDTLEIELLPGVYWLAVDGEIASDGPGGGEGVYQLSIRCEYEAETIECGEIITDQTTGRLSNFDILDYGGCFESVINSYDAGDRLYRFEVLEKKMVEINMNNIDNQGLDLFLLSSAINIQTGEVFPAFCVGKSDTGSVSEQIKGILEVGIYWIIVDGTQDGDVLNEGSYDLSISCPFDYESISCGEPVMGNTAVQVNYHGSTEYALCAPAGQYEGGDITYLFDLPNDDDVTINLTPLAGDNLALILVSASFDEGTMKYSLDTCMAFSDTSTTMPGFEKISMELTEGTYFIIVDGIVNNDTASAGPFMLEVVCKSLPIELVSFTGSRISEGIKVDWATASEVGFEGFYLQRSENGDDWNNLVWQGSKGSATSMTQYSYLDLQPMPGANFYRLRSVDLDGTINISSIIQVDFDGNDAQAHFSVYPTLATDWVHVQGIRNGSTVKYEIRTVLGNLVRRGTLGSGNQELDLSGITSGMLYLTLRDGKEFKTVAIQKL
ncbi:MAG: T9SS type A sorting domain-containing protein [Saprospiraceae bacterium]|nr:T9SS type A sorting domain-containing protein [Saprospiraceae bacterium]